MDKKVYMEVKGREWKQEFTLQHAQNIIDFQNKKGRHDWVLSDGQDLTLEDGSIRPVRNTKADSKRKATGRS